MALDGEDVSLLPHDRRRAPTRHRGPVRWVDGLAGATLIGAVIAVAVVIPAAATPPAAATVTPAPAIALGRPVDEQSCLESARALDDVGRAITAAGGPHGDDVAAAVASARTRVGRQLATSSGRLRPIVTDLDAALGTLLDAVRGGSAGTAAPTDRLLDIIDRLDARCQAALAPAGRDEPTS